MKSVIIVESPTKSKTIESYLSSDYEVVSSKGHICDLSTKKYGGLGINVNGDFDTEYVQTAEQKKLTASLKKLCKGKKVYLATDPDREGEAISYHLARYLDLDLNDENRIVFHEVTKPAILNAIKSVSKIDMGMVNSQETRRILDRVIGFRVSSLLRSKIKSQSAGRVQSVALKLVCDLEKEIIDFIPQAYYEAEAYFENFKLDLVKLNNSSSRITDRSLLEEVCNNLGPFVVKDITTKETYSESKPPFTTSTLQQEASIRFGFSGSKTMMIAQRLYEGINLGTETVGLITYMRTDSTHLSEIFVDNAKKYIASSFGEKYLGAQKEKTQKLAQNAHEAIRPTNIYYNPEDIKTHLSSDEYRLYKLIYNRALASLMKHAIFSKTKVTFSNYNSEWAILGQTLLFDGYTVLTGIKDEDKNKLIPDFILYDEYKCLEVKILDKETKPKARFTEASLIKEMEEKGIGRPSTYAQTLQTLTKREYVKLVQKRICPTEQGMLTSDLLTKHFPDIFNVSYTASMEAKLDQIAQLEVDKLELLRDFYSDFKKEYDLAYENIEKVMPKTTGELCPICNSPMVIRKGRYGEFEACSNYPTCKYIKQEKKEVVTIDVKCPNCGGLLVERTATKGANKGKKFYSCSNFPKCRVIFNDRPLNELCPNCNSIMLIDENNNKYCSAHCDEIINVKCPNCETGHLVMKVASKGRNKGKTFYSCDNFPKCKTIFNNKPTDIRCELCGSIMVEGEDGLYCSNDKCQNHKK